MRETGTPRPRRKAPARGEPTDRVDARRIAAWGRRACWALEAAGLYVLASLLTDWTGSFGRSCARSLLERFGGAVLLPLLFLCALLLGVARGRGAAGRLRQGVGVLLLFPQAAALLGLWEIAWGASPRPFWLFPGRLGRSLAAGLLEGLGPLGIILIGLVAAAATFWAFGLRLPSGWGETLADRVARLSFSSLRGRLGTLGARLGTLSFRAKARDDGGEEDMGEEDEEEDWESGEPSAEGEAEDLDDTEEEGFDGSLPGEDAPARSDPEASPPTRRRAAVEADALEDDSAPRLAFDEESFDAEDELVLPEPLRAAEFPPPIDLFGPPVPSDPEVGEAQIRPLGEKIIHSLENFGVEAELAETLIGPTVVQFRIRIAPGIKVSRVASLANDLALALAAPSLRIEAPIPGKPYIGIEIPTPRRRPIPLRLILESPAFRETEAILPLPLGAAVDGEPMTVGLEDLPHLLVAGTTGSGKSVFVNACILGLCSFRTPEELRMILVDPKRVEMSFYEHLPHILTPPITEPKQAVSALGWALREMERRYARFAQARVRNLAAYNEKVLPKDRMPSIVIVVDELADLMMTAPKEVEDLICRLAQMARATGIHLILATQRPSVNVLTGLIKANIPARVAFSLPGSMDSRTILDCGGAEKLLGKGDMLFLHSRTPKPVRVQAPWIDERVIGTVLECLVGVFGEPERIDMEESGGLPEVPSEDLQDPLLDEAVRVVLSSGVASVSRLQRALRVGFTRGSRLLDIMERLQLVGPQEGAKPREVLVDEEIAEEILRAARGREP